MAKQSFGMDNDGLRKQQQFNSSQVEHERANQKAETTSDILQVSLKNRVFLIKKIQFSKKKVVATNMVEQTKVRFLFVNVKNEKECILILSATEAYKLVGEIIKKVPDWDLVNPWAENGLGSPEFESKTGKLH